MTRLTENTRGALLMVGSMASFTFGDACVKALSQALPLSQILVIRGALASLFITLLAWRLRQLTLRLPRRDWGLIALRSLAETGAAYFFLTALSHMPLANITAILQVVPLSVTLGSALLYSEPVGWRRWTAILIGFSGMLLIVRPGPEGFDVWSLYALAAVGCVTLRDLVTRRLSRAVPSLTVTLAASLCVLVFAGGWSLGQSWSAIDLRSAILLGCTSLLILSGYSLSVLVMRVGDVSFIAPFRYTGLVWALILGVLVFGEWPTGLTLCGAAIVVSTGLYTLWREARVRRAAARMAAKSTAPLPDIDPVTPEPRDSAPVMRAAREDS